MLTPWLTPRSITVAESDSIPFLDISDSVNIVTPEPVFSVAQGQGRLSTVESDSLLFSDFAVAGTATSAELLLTVSRLGRTQDRIIQFTAQSQSVGPNLADPSAEDRHVYTVHNISVIMDPTVGFVVDLGPHQQYPSVNTVYIRSVRARFNLE